MPCAQATRSSIGTYSPTVWAQSIARGPYMRAGVPVSSANVAPSYQLPRPPSSIDWAHTVGEYVPIDDLVACAQGIAVAGRRLCR